MLFAMVPAVSIAADAPATKAPAKPAATKVDPALEAAHTKEDVKTCALRFFFCEKAVSSGLQVLLLRQDAVLEGSANVTTALRSRNLSGLPTRAKECRPR